MGKRLKGVYHLYHDRIHLFDAQHNGLIQDGEVIEGLDNPRLDELVGDQAEELREEIELVKGASNEFDLEAYLNGQLTPVFFGSAINNFGISELLDDFSSYAPAPQPRKAVQRTVDASEEKITGFIFKIQANMDPKHRDRVAFMRICSGVFEKGMTLKQTRTNKNIKIPDALTFLAADREHIKKAYAGDIIGLHNHGTIRIGDTFTQGEDLVFTGIPNFAPELFRRARLKDPLKNKQLIKGLMQLCEEGATQLFRPLTNNDLILGAVGVLQFDVVEHRLKNEYKVECQFEHVNVQTARWVHCKDDVMLEQFMIKAASNLARDHSGELTYIAPTRVNLQLAVDKWSDIEFLATREHGVEQS